MHPAGQRSARMIGMNSKYSRDISLIVSVFMFRRLGLHSNGEERLTHIAKKAYLSGA